MCFVRLVEQHPLIVGKSREQFDVFQCQPGVGDPVVLLAIALDTQCHHLLAGLSGRIPAASLLVVGGDRHQCIAQVGKRLPSVGGLVT